MNRPLTVIVALLVASVSLTASAYVLDQFKEDLSPGGGETSVTKSTDLAQTFTAGISEVLAFVDIEFASWVTPGAVDVSITKTSSGVPSLEPGDVLATVTAAGGDLVLGWNRFLFEPENVWLEEGEMYAFVMEAAESSTWVRWAYEGGNTYPRGALWNHMAFGQDPPEWRGGTDGNDVHFRTYMVVPEPTALVLVLLGPAAVRLRKRC